MASGYMLSAVGGFETYWPYSGDTAGSTSTSISGEIFHQSAVVQGVNVATQEQSIGRLVVALPPNPAQQMRSFQRLSCWQIGG